MANSILISIICVFLSVPAGAVNLVELPKAPDERLPISQNQPPLACDQILSALMRYNDLARQHDTTVSGFLGEVVERVKTWHSVLSPLEGKAQTISPGTFDPLLTGAVEIENVTNLAFDNGALLSQELDRIIAALSDCQISQ